MIAPTGPFPRSARIRRSREFQSVSRRGRRERGQAFVMLTAASEQRGATRLGVTVSRRVGNAVVRNAVKRRIREWFRQVGRERVVGRDVVVIARPAAADLDGAGVFRELERLAQAAEGRS